MHGLEPNVPRSGAGGAGAAVAGAGVAPGAGAGAGRAGTAGAVEPRAGSAGAAAGGSAGAAAGGAGGAAAGSGAAAAAGGSAGGAAAGSSAGAAAGGSGGAGGPAPRSTTFRNPLNDSHGSDPWLTYHEGNYYLAATTWSSELTIARAPTLDALRDAQPVVVWRGDQPSRCCNMWAPEFHLLDGPSGKRWYLYFTAGPSGSNTDNQRMHVLESAGTDPMGPYTYKARIFDPNADGWAIDASVFTLQGKLYYVFSAWEGDNQNLFIAAMRDPWTLEGGRRRLSTPSYDWERSIANVNEGGVALQHEGKTFIVYSASACWGPDYKLGMLELVGADPLAMSSWRKHREPVFARADGNEAFGPGHNGFFKSPDGSEDWIVYHANDSASGACDTKRTTRAQKLTWKADGTPDFGTPVDLAAELPGPAGE